MVKLVKVVRDHSERFLFVFDDGVDLPYCEVVAKNGKKKKDKKVDREKYFNAVCS